MLLDVSFAGYVLMWCPLFYGKTLSWSEYSTTDGNDGEEDEYDVGCSRQEEGGEEATWYLGNTQCFRANVAYTLYGVKAGETPGSSPCSNSNYINSFFTTKGIEAFGDSVGINYYQYGASSVCTASYNGGYNGYYQNGEGENSGEGDEEEATYQNGQLIFEDYSSSTLGCSASGLFTMATFKGASCDGNHFLGNINDKYNYLNRALNNLECVQVYDAYANAEGEDDAENEEEEGEQDQEAQEEGENEEDDSMATFLLQRSATCSHSEYPGACPDPFNVKKARDSKLHQYAQSKYRAVPAIMPILTTLLAVGAVLLFCLANGIRDSAKRRAHEKAAEDREQSIYENFSQSFHRAATDLTTRTRTFTEKLAAYAEEEDEEPELVADAGTYEAPPAEEEQTEVADAMLSEKGVTPKTDDKNDKKQYKRPRMARFSKWLRKKFGKKNRTSK